MRLHAYTFDEDGEEMDYIVETEEDDLELDEILLYLANERDLLLGLPVGTTANNPDINITYDEEG